MDENNREKIPVDNENIKSDSMPTGSQLEDGLMAFPGEEVPPVEGIPPQVTENTGGQIPVEDAQPFQGVPPQMASQDERRQAEAQAQPVGGVPPQVTENTGGQIPVEDAQPFQGVPPQMASQDERRQAEAQAQPVGGVPPQVTRDSNQTVWGNAIHKEAAKQATFHEGTKKQENCDPEHGYAKEQCYHERVKEQNKKKKGHSWKRFIAACVIISFVGGGTMGISLGLTQKYLDTRYGYIPSTEEAEETTPSTVKTAVSKMSGGKSTVEIVKEVKPSVVSISTTTQTMMQSFGGFGRIPYEAQGAGSGIIFYKDDEKVGIATNFHVIEDANHINVTLNEDVTVTATVAGTDSTADLAVLTISRADLEAAGISDVRVATFGDSDALEEGEKVIAIGNALGEGITVTDGIVSATGKTINVDGRELQVVQTNAAINQGNSGGALVNEYGQVIGINTAKAMEYMVEGMGYAIPSNVISPIIDKLLVEGTEPKPYIGIRGVDVTDEVAQLYRLKVPVGVLVVEVIPDSAAEKAGLKPSDIITGLAGKNVISMDQLVEVLANQTVGDTVTMNIIRDGEKPVDLQITILDANQQDI